MASLDLAIRLVNQAVHQDFAKNYEEAARCYREAVIALKSISRSRKATKRVRHAIEEKTVQYEARLRKLERHLLSRADLTQLFRDCVHSETTTGEEQIPFAGDDASSLSSSDESEDSRELAANAALKPALAVIRRAKKADSKSRLREAIQLYEEGSGSLFNEIRKGRTTEDEKEIIRIKCLLIHDRCDVIRNHLELGQPLAVRKGHLMTLEESLEKSSSTSVSPLLAPASSEDKLFDMSEIQSLSMEGSTHSLYPMTVEISRSGSERSEASDEGNPSLSPFIIEKSRTSPLASMGDEMKISTVSLASKESLLEEKVPINYIMRESMDKLDIYEEDDIFTSSLNNSLEEKYQGTEEVQVHIVTSKDGYHSDSTNEEEELNYIVNEDARSLLPPRPSSVATDSGSDSGFSDPPNIDESCQGSPVNCPPPPPAQPVVVPEPEVKEEDIPNNDSVINVDVDVLASNDGEESRSAVSSPLRSKSSSPTPSSGSRRSRRSERRAARNLEEEAVTVLSEETVVDGKPVPEVKVRVAPEVYSKAGPSQRQEYIPPRAFARQQPDRGDENDLNQGCYYFVACLDSFWIL